MNALQREDRRTPRLNLQQRVGGWLTRAASILARGIRAVPGVARDTHRRAVHRDLMLVASGLAYITIVTVFPIMTLSFVIFRSVGGTERLVDTLEPLIHETLTPRTGQKVLEGLTQLLARLNSGTLTAFSFIVLAFSSMALFSSVEQAINRVWETPIKRSFVKRVTAYLLLLTLGPVVFAIAVGLGTSDLKLTGILPRATFGYPLLVAVFFLIYKWAPNRPVRWLPALISAFFTATLWSLVRLGLRLYLSTVWYADYYGRIYGSVAIVIILVILIFIAWLVVLTGACLTAAIQGLMEESRKGGEFRAKPQSRKRV